MHNLKRICGLTVIIIGALECGACGGGGGSGDDGGRGTAGGAGNGQNGASSVVVSVDGFCAATCNKEHACDTHVDVQTCTNSCKGELAGIADKLRADFLSHVIDCYTNADCASVLKGDAGNTCNEEAVASLSPTEKGKAFCGSLETALEKCDSTLDKANCYDLVKTYDDGTLVEAQQCFSKSCSTLSDCVNATL